MVLSLRVWEKMCWLLYFFFKLCLSLVKIIFRCIPSISIFLQAYLCSSPFPSSSYRLTAYVIPCFRLLSVSVSVFPVCLVSNCQLLSPSVNIRLFSALHPTLSASTLCLPSLSSSSVSLCSSPSLSLNVQCTVFELRI